MSTDASTSGMAKAVEAAFWFAKTLASFAINFAAVTFNALHALAKRAMEARAAALEAAKVGAQAAQQPTPQHAATGDLISAVVPAAHHSGLSGPARAAAQRRHHHHKAALAAAAVVKRHEGALQHVHTFQMKPHLHKAEATWKRLEVGPRPGKLLERHQHRQQGKRDGVHKATTR